MAAPRSTDTWWSLAPALLARHLVASRTEEPDHADLLARATAGADEALGAFRTMLAGGASAFAQVCAASDLDEVDAAVLAILATCEIDPETLRLACAEFGQSSARPTGALVLGLLGADGVVALAAGGRLDRAGLVEVEPSPPLVAAALAVPRAVVWRLLDLEPDYSELPPDIQTVRCPPDLVGTANRLLVSGTDRQRRLEAAAAHAIGLLFYAGPAPSDHDGWRALTRRAALDGAGLIIDLAAAPDALLRSWIDRCDHLTWVLSRNEPIDLSALPADAWRDVHAEAPAITEAEWSAVFDTPAPDRRPSAEQLATVSTRLADGYEPAEAIRRVASGTLLKHATRITPRVGWDELILPPAQAGRLHDLIARYRYRSVVHDEWGLPLYPSPGVVALFSGPSGTGKTTTAEVIAHELGVDMFRVDLSALVSKYIGETEKNLEEIFSAAHAGDYLLLFDEADSLFGSRSKVSDARDRYANMEVSYLLQRLETYDGFVVLTSNFQGNIDQAFLRRIHVTVHFAVPTVEDRARIWDRSLGNAPRDDLDLAFVADKFDLTGGSIRNAALTAAFFAAGGRRAITMVDVLLAVTQEMIKLGRRPNDDQYGRWLNELKD
jgi:hypothetical protein